MTSIPQPFAPPVYGQRDGEYVTPASEQPMSNDEARAWWRWHFAGQIAAALVAHDEGGGSADAMAQDAAAYADALVAELER